MRSYSIAVTPNPSDFQCTELDGNNTETIWFSGLHDELLIEVHAVVETHYRALFNLLVTDHAALSLPIKYEPHLALVLSPYLLRDEDDPAVAAFSQEILQAAEGTNHTVSDAASGRNPCAF